MSDITPELGLQLCVGNDDTADYLSAATGLRSSLSIIDGLFNSGTGHNHSGAHQGGAISFQNLTISGNLTVNGTTEVKGALIADQTLHVASDSTLANTTMSGTLHVTGTSALDGTITGSNEVLSGTLSVGGVLTANSNASVAGTLNTGGQLTVPSINDTGSLSVGTTATIGQTLTVNGAVSMPAGISTGGITNTGNESISGTLTVGTVNTTNLSVSSVNMTLGGYLLTSSGGSFRVGQMTAWANNDVSIGQGALGVGATTGFPQITRMAGNPTGTPADLHGGAYAAIVSAPGRLYVNDGSGWKYATLT